MRKHKDSTEPVSVKLLLANSIVEGTLDMVRNEKLGMPHTNGFSEHSGDEAAVYLTDVAIRPLSNPEVHVGLNELQLFLDSVVGIIGPLPH
jgi:hypothetical protein